MLTEFGKMLRKIRIDHEQLLIDMAEKLEVTASYLSAVEMGKRNIPERWVEKIVKVYNLDQKQKKQLEEAAYNSKQQIKVPINDLEKADRNLVLSFARQFKGLGEDEKEQILAILNKKQMKE